MENPGESGAEELVFPPPCKSLNCSIEGPFRRGSITPEPVIPVDRPDVALDDSKPWAVERRPIPYMIRFTILKTLDIVLLHPAGSF